MEKGKKVPKDQRRIRVIDLRLISVAAVLTMCRQTAALACPLCKEAVEKIGDVWTSQGFNLSIYFMLAVPFILVGSFVGVLYLKNKHAQR